MRQLVAVAAILGVNDACLLGVGGASVVGASHPSYAPMTQSTQSGYRLLGCSGSICRYTDAPTPMGVPDPSPTLTVPLTPSRTPTPAPASMATFGPYLPEGAPPRSHPVPGIGHY
jgi:hypothetical protein